MLSCIPIHNIEQAYTLLVLHKLKNIELCYKVFSSEDVDSCRKVCCCDFCYKLMI